MDIHYHSFNSSRADERWDSFLKLDRKGMFEALGFPDQPLTRQDLEGELIYLDLRFGAVSAELHEPKYEAAFLYILLSVFAPEWPLLKRDAFWSDSFYDESGILHLPVAELQTCIDLFNIEKVRAWIIDADEKTAGRINIWEEDLDWALPAISRYVKQIAPVIHDLVENPTSIFVWECNADTNSPLLEERKKMHSEQLLRDHPEMCS